MLNIIAKKSFENKYAGNIDDINKFYKKYKKLIESDYKYKKSVL